MGDIVILDILIFVLVEFLGFQVCVGMVLVR